MKRIRFVFLLLMSTVLVLVFLKRADSENHLQTGGNQKEMTMSHYQLVAVGEESKTKEIHYKIPDLEGHLFVDVCTSGLIEKILAHGATVLLKFESQSLDEKTDKKLLEIGTYIVSVEPKEFGIKDEIVIKLNNFALSN